MKAEVYSHGVRLSEYTRDIFLKLTSFLEALSLKEPQKLPHGKMVMVLKKRYYGLTQNQSELFIHKRNWDDLLQHLKDRGYDESHINRVDIDIPVGQQATYVVKDMYQLFDYQIPIVNELSDLGRPSSRLDLQTGKAKPSVL